MNDVNAVIQSLGLHPHPEGGFYKEMHRSTTAVLEPGKPSSKDAYSSIYYLLSGHDFSAWHRIQSDETWFYHLGCDLMIYHFDKGGSLIETPLGLQSGRLQTTVLANTWFAARPLDPDSFSLVSCVVGPGFVFTEFEMGQRHALMNAFGKSTRDQEIIQTLTRN